MKLLDEKGRLFGRINIIDFILLLAIVLAAGAAVWYFAGQNISDTGASSMSKIAVTCRIRGAQPWAVEEIKSMNINENRQQLVAGNNYVDNAYLISARFEPFKLQVMTADGRVVSTADPDRQDVVVVIEALVPSNSPIAKIGSQELRVGRDHLVKTKFIEYVSTVENVKYLDSDGDGDA